GMLTASVPQLFQVPQQGAVPIVAQSMPASTVSSVGASAVVAESTAAKPAPVPAGVVQAASTVAKADRAEAKSKTVGSLLSAYDDDADSEEGDEEAKPPAASNPVLESRLAGEAYGGRGFRGLGV
ncbi:unnamed protein product, partial [Symbiodinium necroappetens]